MSAMIVSELCEMAGITRQWLNKQVDAGKVPGCCRKLNGRLEISDCREVTEWISITSSLQKKKRGKRLSLQQRLGRMGDSSTAESFTATELARKIGVSAATIKRQVLEIPGAYADNIGYRFQNTKELRQWVETEITTRFLEKERLYRERLKRGSLGLSKAPFLRAGAAVSKAQVEINRVIKTHHFKTWATPEIRSFKEDLGYMVKLWQDVDKELSGRKKQSNPTYRGSG
jgi:hypothetical protein